MHRTFNASFKSAKQKLANSHRTIWLFKKWHAYEISPIKNSTQIYNMNTNNDENNSNGDGSDGGDALIEAVIIGGATLATAAACAVAAPVVAVVGIGVALLGLFAGRK
jgi:hypothetical protein